MKFFLFFLIITSCMAEPEEPSDDPVLFETTCEKAENKLKEMNCTELLCIPGPDEIKNTDDDIAWRDYCEAMQLSLIVTIDTDCIAKTTNCNQANDCLNK